MPKPPNSAHRRLPESQGSGKKILASISRSGGLGGDGDSLKDRGTQEEYRKYLQEKKLDSLSKDLQELDLDLQTLTNKGEDMMLLTRKLREGILASRRTDGFAIEVYEISFYLAIIFDSASYAISTSSHLLSSLYLPLVPTKPLEDDRSLIVTLSLLRHLCHSPIGQTQFWKELSVARRSSFLCPPTSQYEWIVSIAAALRYHNYIAFDRLSRSPGAPSSTLSSVTHSPLAMPAVERMLERLRISARASCTAVLRRSYVDFHDVADTREWLCRLACLKATPHNETDGTARPQSEVDRWFEQLCNEGQFRRKDDTTPQRWVVNKKYGLPT